MRSRWASRVPAVPEAATCASAGIDEVEVQVHASRTAMGRAAAVAIAVALRRGLRERASVRMIFAAAPS